MDRISIREAINSDIEQCLTWRNNPKVYSGFYLQKEPLMREQHYTWWFSRNKDYLKLIVEKDKIPIGMVTLSQLDHWSPEIGYWIGDPSLWGKGYGKEAVRLSLELLKLRNFKFCHATLLIHNERSLRLLKSLGFEIQGPARENELWLIKKL